MISATTVIRPLFVSAIVFAAGAICRAAADVPLTEDDARWREKIGFNPQVHAAVQNSSDAEVFARVPYAYYPYSNELEVVFDAAAAAKLLPADAPKPADDLSVLRVRVFPAAVAPELLTKYPFYYAPAPVTPADPQKAVASGTIALDAKGRGHGVIRLPELAAGNYRVEYEFGGARLTASRTFRRTRFEWENCTYGAEHKVYAPFTPVTVVADKVSVVDRTYTINALGLFDSVISKGRELLAEPMKLVVEDAAGKRLEWKGGGWFSSGVKGSALYPDLARFECEARSEISNLKSEISVEEDGCAKVRMTLEPRKRSTSNAQRPTSNVQRSTSSGESGPNTEHRTPTTQISRAWIEMALKETEAPLCHFVGMNSMRHNYAGLVPRGGKITWINQAWRPARFEIEPFNGPAPASYQVWEARNQMHWGSEKWSFAPYVWLGAEECGLAWFGDHTQGYETDGARSIQRVYIEPGRVVLRVELIQKPVALDMPRTFEFGLQASPTKPLRPDWRGYNVPGGGGMSVVVFGGFNCADKVPANKDWTLVDKIMEGRKTGKADYAWFVEYAKTHTTVVGGGGATPKDDLRVVPLEQAQANGQPWLTAVHHFAGREAGRGLTMGSTVYYEEHQTSGRYPEVAEFMDEWSDSSFARYRYFDYPLTWGPEIRSANPASYRDFAVFYANEWMKRGIGIYYDNTYPQVDRNRAHFGGRDLAWSSSIWGHRDYYKRVWKRSRELMATGESPLPLHTVGHVTNCQVIPFTTWWDATLGVEAPGQWDPDDKPSAEAVAKMLDEWSFVILGGPSKDKPGRALPYPPDYLRAMECGRMAGLIPHYRHLLRSEDAFGGIGISYGATDQGKDPEVREHRYLSDAAMGLIHEIRGGASGYDHPRVGAVRRAIKEFGYGTPAVTVFNYWDDGTPVTVANPQVKWLAMTRCQVSGVGCQDQKSKKTASDTSLKPETRHLETAPMGLLLLQSYSPDALSTAVRFAGGAVFVDAETRETIAAAANGSVTLAFPADYGTRLVYVLARAGQPPLLPNTKDTVLVDDFELGLGYRLGVSSGGFEVAPDNRLPANHVLRVRAGHPAQNLLRPQAVTLPGDHELSFRFRLPEVPEKIGKSGLLTIGYRDADKRRYHFGLGFQRGNDSTARWTVSAPLLVYDGGRNEGYQTPAAAPVAADQPFTADGEWHTITIRVKGSSHDIRLDGRPVFAGSDDRNLTGGFVIAPGWGWELPVPFVELDDIRVEALR